MAVVVIAVCLRWAILLAVVLEAVARRQQLPILSEDLLSPTLFAKISKSTECHFGSQLKEIGSTWYPDLGVPFGTMYCVRCECEAVHKIRRITARVRCRNVNQGCKDPPADAIAMSTASPNEEDERNVKHFAALLTGRSSLGIQKDNMSYLKTSQYEVATGRFMFHRKNLYYSFYTTGPRPKMVQLIDETGTILMEQQIAPVTDDTPVPYQNNTGKVCGVWRRLARDYRRLLREKRLFAGIIWSESGQELTATGPISSYRGLNTELFSAILTPPSGSKNEGLGFGGTAIVSANTHATPIIHMQLVFNGVFSGEDAPENVPIVVRLETEKGNSILEEVVQVEKPSNDLNMIEIRSTMTAGELRLLARSKLTLIIENEKNPAYKLVGPVQARVACEIFQTPLSMADSDEDDLDSKDLGNIGSIQRLEPDSKFESPTAGLAWLFVTRHGGLNYHIQLEQLSESHMPIVLALVAGKGRKRVELEDLTPGLRYDPISQTAWANGTLERLSPRALQDLYAGELAVNVATRRHSSLVRGKLASRPVADARDAALAPVLLQHPPSPIASDRALVGMAWVGVDIECTLHYEVMISGLIREDRGLRLYLEETPVPDAIDAPIYTRLLDEFQGYSHEGFLLNLEPKKLAHLEAAASRSTLYVRDVTGLGNTLLRAGMNEQLLRVPSSCLPKYTDNDVPGSVLLYPQEPMVAEQTSCFFEKRFYKEGVQWRARGDTCTMCHCYRALIRCDKMPCPILNCPKEQQRTLPDECCPVCSNDESLINLPISATPRGCMFADQFHAAGSSWHPYLPPAGFDTCTLCACSAISLKVHCSRIQCPLLTNCTEKEAIRKDKKSCCKECPPSSSIFSDTADDAPFRARILDTAAIQAQQTQHIPTGKEIIAAGGCVIPAGTNRLPYVPNGHIWHPRVLTGPIKCVQCKCKDGKLSCWRKQCSSCPVPGLRSKQHNTTDINAAECCQYCRRQKRQQRHHRP